MELLNKIREERAKWMEWKNIRPLRQAIDNLPFIETELLLNDTIELKADVSNELLAQIEKVAQMMDPWRKGPFKLFDLFIDAEWKSYQKYNLLKPYFNLKDKIVGDIGCNNGYYMFRMLEEEPKQLIGFDPSAIFKTQFDFINHFAQTNIKYELLGVEHLDIYDIKFDILFCLGVLYHRGDPVAMLKSLKKGLNKGGEVILDTFMIDGDLSYALCPAKTYSKIPNISFIPTVAALKNWCHRAGFNYFEVLEIKITTNDEQRGTKWIKTQSLEDFLDPEDNTKTVEGYPAPKRIYVKLKIEDQ